MTFRQWCICSMAFCAGLACCVFLRAADTNSDVEYRVLTLINQERAKGRLAPVVMTDTMLADARRSAAAQNKRRDVGHFTALNGSSEICASGNNPETAIRLWMQSKGHRAQIMGSAKTHASVANEGRYWVVRFSSQGYQWKQATYTKQVQTTVQKQQSFTDRKSKRRFAVLKQFFRR